MGYQYGLQLYSVRDAAEQNLENAVAEVAKMGYSYVEFAGFFGRTPEQVNAMLKENNIALSGTHSGFDDLVNDFDNTLAYHKAIGNKYYIIPGHDLSSQEKLDTFVERVNPIIEKLKAEGITLGYHNHAHEFRLNEDGSCIYEQLLYRTNLKFEIDTYWAFVGMKNPLKLIDRVGDRLIAVHVKDGSAEGAGTPLGLGEAPVADVWAKVKDMGIPMVVESETCKPSGLDEAKICIDYLKKLG